MAVDLPSPQCLPSLGLELPFTSYGNWLARDHGSTTTYVLVVLLPEHNSVLVAGAHDGRTGGDKW